MTRSGLSDTYSAVMEHRDILNLTRRSILGGAAAVAMIGSTTAKGALVQKKAPAMSRFFNRDRFVEDCVIAHRAQGMAAVQEVLTEAVSNHASVLADLGPPTKAGLDVMHRSTDLTIFAAHWTPQMNLLSHDHAMAALIGIYTGREDNILWRRSAEGIEAVRASCLFEGDVVALAADAIHSVTNPLLRFTGGIHIYGGDFFDAHRHQWDPETLIEAPSDGDAIRAIFARENERGKSACRKDAVG